MMPLVTIFFGVLWIALLGIGAAFLITAEERYKRTGAIILAISAIPAALLIICLYFLN